MLQKVIRGYREFQELQDVRGGYNGLKALTEGCKRLQKVTRGYRGFPGLQGVNGGYKGLQGGNKGLNGVTSG